MKAGLLSGRIFRPAAALNLLCCKSFCMFRFLFAALLKISVICSIYRAIFVGYTIYNFKGIDATYGEEWKEMEKKQQERQKEKTDTRASTYLSVFSGVFFHRVQYSMSLF